MSSHKILVVEDEPDLRNVYSLILRHAGYEVFESTNGKEALDEVEKSAPDLVLLDIFMPVMDGPTFLRNIDLNKHPDMKIIVCSNTADKELMDDMMGLGADKIVTKSTLAPKDLTELVAGQL